MWVRITLQWARGMQQNTQGAGVYAPPPRSVQPGYLELSYLDERKVIMAAKSKYDYKFRPGSYWDSGLDEIHAAIAGQWRREAVETAEQHGTLNQSDPVTCPQRLYH